MSQEMNNFVGTKILLAVKCLFNDIRLKMWFLKLKMQIDKVKMKFYGIISQNWQGKVCGNCMLSDVYFYLKRPHEIR